MRKIRSAVLLGAAAIIGLVIFMSLIPEYSACYSMDSRLTRGDVQEISWRVAAKLGVDLPNNLMQNTTYEQDGIALTYLQDKAGTRLANTLVRSDSIPANHWTVLWFDPEKQWSESEKFEVRVSQSGNLLGFKRYLPDSMSGNFTDEAAARSALTSYWNKHNLSGLTKTNISHWTLKNSEPIRLEHRIELTPGDVLVFYTDGFTEAMDSQAREFGEENLVRLIDSTRHLRVNEMLARIESGVRKFVGNAPQHDDMTMMAMKIMGNNGMPD